MNAWHGLVCDAYQVVGIGWLVAQGQRKARSDVFA